MRKSRSRGKKRSTGAASTGLMRTHQERFGEGAERGEPDGAEPESDRPSTAALLRFAEDELFRAEFALNLYKMRCGKPSKCLHQVCRRRGRCREQDDILPMVADLRAQLAEVRAGRVPADTMLRAAPVAGALRGRQRR